MSDLLFLDGIGCVLGAATLFFGGRYCYEVAREWNTSYTLDNMQLAIYGVWGVVVTLSGALLIWRSVEAALG